MCAKVYIRLHKLKYEVRACTDGVLTVLSYTDSARLFQTCLFGAEPKTPKRATERCHSVYGRKLFGRC